MKDLNKFAKNFSERKFVKKAKALLAIVGYKSIYSALLLFHAYKRKETPYWAKHIVLGALGYLLTPIDFLPDLTPIIGYTDDIGILSFGLMTIACYVSPEVRIAARKNLKTWFGDLQRDLIEEVDDKL